MATVPKRPDDELQRLAPQVRREYTAAIECAARHHPRGMRAVFEAVTGPLSVEERMRVFDLLSAETEAAFWECIREEAA